MVGVRIKVIEFLFDQDNWIFSIVFNIWAIIIVIAIIFLINYLILVFKNKNIVDKNIKLVKLSYKIAGVQLIYEIENNYNNIEIAHRVYIELITRKAAILIEPKKDVLVEIYDSWYSLFQITRNELKSFNGKLIKDNKTSKELVKLLTDVLNKGLRPHLTEYQARYRKWYSEQLLLKKNNSPQEIQKKFKDYDELIKSMSVVNKVLIEYSKQLKKLIES